MVWTMPATTCPVRTAVREMAIDRRRVTNPVFMSDATPIVVPLIAPITAIRSIPGVR